jgi:hypothetical protein
LDVLSARCIVWHEQLEIYGMESEVEAADTPDAFLKTLAESLKGQEGADADMADILNAHILKTAPEPNAVALAKNAILKLAGERAKPSKLEVAGG